MHIINERPNVVFSSVCKMSILSESSYRCIAEAPEEQHAKNGVNKV